MDFLQHQFLSTILLPTTIYLYFLLLLNSGKKHIKLSISYTSASPETIYINKILSKENTYVVPLTLRFFSMYEKNLFF